MYIFLIFDAIKIYVIEKSTIYTYILNTRPDRPVQPGTGHQSGPIIIKNRNRRKTEKNRKPLVQPEKSETAMVKPVLESEEE